MCPGTLTCAALSLATWLQRYGDILLKGGQMILKQYRMCQHCCFSHTAFSHSHPSFSLQVCQSTEAEGAVEPLPNQCHPNNTLVCQAPLAAGALPVQPANETAANETAANETAGGGSSSSSVPVGAIVGGAVGGIGECTWQVPHTAGSNG